MEPRFICLGNHEILIIQELTGRGRHSITNVFEDLRPLHI